MKLVINRCYGGFSLSEEQAKAMGIEGREIGGNIYYDTFDTDRADPKLIEAVEAGLPNARYSNLEVVEIPDGVFYEVQEYDGYESVVYSASEIFHA